MQRKTRCYTQYSTQYLVFLATFCVITVKKVSECRREPLLQHRIVRAIAGFFFTEPRTINSYSWEYSEVQLKNQILHGKYRAITRVPCGIQDFFQCISENRLPLGQCMSYIIMFCMVPQVPARGRIGQLSKRKRVLFWCISILFLF